MQKAVERAAKLAKLSVNADEVARYARDLEDILKHIDLIQELDLTDTPATTHALNLVCPTRADEPQRVLDPDKALSAAPAREGQAFKVPKFIE